MNPPVTLGEVKQKQEVILLAKRSGISKTMYKTYDTELTKFVLSAKTPDSRLLIAQLTVHCLLASHVETVAHLSWE